jgi:PKD repeat protein
MALPVSSYTFEQNGLEVNFKDTSTGLPTSWEWDFGDGTAVDNTQNPAHTYGDPGVYNVSLKVTNAEGSNTFVYTWVFRAEPGLSLTIAEMVKEQMGINLTYTNLYLDQVVKKWQLYLQNAAEILDADVFNEAKWPSLYNAMISKLIVREAMINIISKAVSSAANTGKGGLKKIETGPSSAEWYEASTSISNMTRTSSGGTVKDVEDEVCDLAIRLEVRFHFCPKIRKTFIFQVAKKIC